MATVEKVFAEGPAYSFAFVLDDVQQVITGLHVVNNSGHTLIVDFVYDNVDHSAPVPTGTNGVFPLPQPKPYTIGVNFKGGQSFIIPGLSSYGVRSA